MSFSTRILGFGLDVLTALRDGTPRLPQVFDREYMASWHMFHGIPPSAVKVLVDIGACDGLYALRADRYFSLERVIAVEPLPHKAQGLRRLSLPNLTVVEKACADQVRTAKFHVNQTEQASSLRTINPSASEEFGFAMSPQAEISIETTTLDTLCQELSLGRIDLLKIDVQGAERELLLDGGNTLAVTHYLQLEVLLMEHYFGCADFPELHALLSNQGFRLCEIKDFSMNERGEIIQADALYRNTRLTKQSSGECSILAATC